MDTTVISIVASWSPAVIPALGLIVHQIRIGLRDRGDRQALIENPYAAAHLIKLRRAQSPSQKVQRRSPKKPTALTGGGNG